MAGASINPTNVNMPTPRETSLVAGSSVPCSFQLWWVMLVMHIGDDMQGSCPLEHNAESQNIKKWHAPGFNLYHWGMHFRSVPAASNLSLPVPATSTWTLDIAELHGLHHDACLIASCHLSSETAPLPCCTNPRLTNAGDNHGEPRSRLAQVVPNFNLSSSWTPAKLPFWNSEMLLASALCYQGRTSLDTMSGGICQKAKGSQWSR